MSASHAESKACLKAAMHMSRCRGAASPSCSVSSKVDRRCVWKRARLGRVLTHEQTSLPPLLAEWEPVEAHLDLLRLEVGHSCGPGTGSSS